MKLIINLQYVIIVIFFLGCNVHKKIEYWDNGNVKSIKKFKRGDDVLDYRMRHGKQLFYYKNGNKSRLEIYRNDTLVKYRKTWYENGKLSNLDNIIGYTYFADSLADGSTLIYYSLNYRTKHYYQNGCVESEGEIVSGKKQKLWSFYDEKGNLLRKEIYKNDSLVR